MQKTVLANDPILNSSTKPLHHQTRFVAWIPVILFMVLAAGIRFFSNSDIAYLLSGGDGPYFPLQVRTLLEQHRLAYPDMPLLFIIGALVAKVLLGLEVGNTDQCVLMAVRITDAFLPPLAAIPVFLFAKELRPTGIKQNILTYLVVAYAIINYTVTYNFSFQLQKNGLGVLWMYGYLLFSWQLVKYRRKIDLYRTLVILFLCAITHFGSFTLLVLFSFLLGIVFLIQNRKTLSSFSPKKVAAGLGAFVFLLLVVAVFDADRFLRLVYIPLRIFEYPVLWIIMDGQDLATLLSPIMLVTMTPLVLLAAVLLIIYRKRMDRLLFGFSVALLAMAFILTSPLLGLEWANRLYLMSFLPIAILYLILFTTVTRTWITLFPALMFFGLILLSAGSGIFQQRIFSITVPAFEAFKKLKQVPGLGAKAMILGRQDLRLLASWVVGTKGSSDYLFQKADFNKYSSVYLLKQINGSNLPPHRFREPFIPKGADTVFAGAYFQLFQISADLYRPSGEGKPSRARGKIVAMRPGQITLLNEKSGMKRTVDLAETAEIRTMHPGEKLKTGMYVEVWGSWKVFSLHVAGEQIVETPKPE